MRWTIIATVCLMLQPAFAQALSVAELVNRGVSFAKQGNYPEAIGTYEKALALDSNYVPAQLNLGLAYFKTAQYAKAIKWLERAARQGVDSDQIHTLLAMSYYSTKQYRSASIHFKALFERKPANATAQYFLAESYLRSHQSNELSDLFHELQTKSPSSPVIHMIAGERYDQLDRIPEAWVSFSRLPRLLQRCRSFILQSDTYSGSSASSIKPRPSFGKRANYQMAKWIRPTVIWQISPSEVMKVQPNHYCVRP